MGNFTEPDGYIDHFQIVHAGGDEADGDGLDPACGQPRHHLLPEHRRDLVAVEAVEDAPRLLRVDEADVKAAQESALAPFEVSAELGGGGENPYTIQSDLQQSMNDLVGIIRTASELEQSLTEVEAFKVRAKSMKVEGHRQYNPGWHLALDLENLIGISEAVTRSALVREESRGGHTREDFPKPDPEWGTKNVVIRKRDGRLVITTEPEADLE